MDDEDCSEEVLARVPEVEVLVAERNDKRKNREYDAADALRERLSRDFSVWIDDKTKSWRFEKRQRREAPPAAYRR